MSSAMDSLMSTVDTLTSVDSSLESPVAIANSLGSSAGFVAKSPPHSSKDAKLSSNSVSTAPASAAICPSKKGGSALGFKNTSPSNTATASSLKTRSLDGLGPGHGMDNTSTTTTVSTTSSAPGRSGSTNDENAFLFLGSLQVIFGILMGVFGVLCLIHNSAMANVGSGIWGGAVSVISGVVGMIAGLRSCYAGSLRGGPGSGRSPLAPTAFMALSLVTIATANLVLVLTAIGLVRDARSPDIQLLREDEDAEGIPASPGSTHWERVLASCGLLLASALQVLAAISSGYRCYRIVCPCAARKHSPLYNQRSSGSPDSLHSGLYSSGSKERLVSRWLTRQAPSGAGHLGPIYTGSPTPNGLLLFSTQPPPPGHHAQTVYTLTQPPSPAPPMMHAGFPPGYSTGPPYYPHYLNLLAPHPPRYHIRHPPRHHRHVSMRAKQMSQNEERERERRDKEREREREREHRERRERRQAKPKPLTDADVARTYTGLDRRIAEEFIMAMDHGRQAASHD